MKLHKIYKVFAYFKCNHQQYSLLSIMSLQFNSIQNTLTNLNFLYYSRPMFPGKHGDTLFSQFWTVLQKPTMRPCWQPNQGECLDRLISIYGFLSCAIFGTTWTVSSVAVVTYLTSPLRKHFFYFKKSFEFRMQYRKGLIFKAFNVLCEGVS